jgi:trk system potassium uptake protein TrkH
MLTPLIVAKMHESHYRPFWLAFIVTFLSGLVIYSITWRTKQRLRAKDGFIVVLGIWLVIAFFGTIPYMLSDALSISFTHAFFESMSGYTTTGATVIEHLNHLPKSLLYYRQQTQFLGGMGIIVLAIAVLPLIGVGGMQLYRAEANGPWKENKLTPRITETAKAMFSIYAVLTVLCVVSYRLCDLSWFNAICYAYSTVATGGFAPHDANIGHYNHHNVYVVCMFFMFIGGVSFALHFMAVKRFEINHYWEDPEFKGFVYYLIGTFVVICLTLIAVGFYDSVAKSVWETLFQVVSFGTTTGFTSNSDYAEWPLFIPVLLAFVGLIGGCAGSTSGGLKIIRAILVREQALREMKRLIHPNGIFPIKIGKKVMSDQVVYSVWGFISAYFLIFMIAWLVIMSTGIEAVTAFSAVASCLSNLGPGIGEISVNYADLSPITHWLLGGIMIIGRLEVFTVLVLFMPDFWRK